MRSCPVALIVVYDTRTRAPASEGDVLGYPSVTPNRYLRVRREMGRFTHHSSFAAHDD